MQGLTHARLPLSYIPALTLLFKTFMVAWPQAKTQPPHTHSLTALSPLIGQAPAQDCPPCLGSYNLACAPPQTVCLETPQEEEEEIT